MEQHLCEGNRSRTIVIQRRFSSDQISADVLKYAMSSDTYWTAPQLGSALRFPTLCWLEPRLPQTEETGCGEEERRDGRAASVKAR